MWSWSCVGIWEGHAKSRLLFKESSSVNCVSLSDEFRILVCGPQSLNVFDYIIRQFIHYSGWILVHDFFLELSSSDFIDSLRLVAKLFVSKCLSALLNLLFKSFKQVSIWIKALSSKIFCLFIDVHRIYGYILARIVFFLTLSELFNSTEVAKIPTWPILILRVVAWCDLVKSLHAFK